MYYHIIPRQGAKTTIEDVNAALNDLGAKGELQIICDPFSFVLTTDTNRFNELELKLRDLTSVQSAARIDTITRDRLIG